jgi:hypothetical protein
MPHLRPNRSGLRPRRDPAPDSPRYGPPSGQQDELDPKSSILTLIPCGCHILGDACPTIRRLLAAAAGRDDLKMTTLSRPEAPGSGDTVTIGQLRRIPAAQQPCTAITARW